MRMLRDFDLRPVLPHITLPTVVVAGTHDQLTPLAGNELIADHIPGARLEVTGKIGAIDLDAGTVRVELAVTDPGQDGAKVLTKAQALVRLTPSGSDG